MPDEEPTTTTESPAVEPGPVEETVARGRAWSTPFLLVGSVAAVVWTTAALVALVALLVWWLA